MENYKEVLQLDKLYEVAKRGGSSASEQLEPSFWVNAGSVDVYVSNSATQPTTRSQMTLDTDDVNIAGIRQFGVIPTYIFVTQNTDVTTEVVVAGLEVEDLGAI